MQFRRVIICSDPAILLHPGQCVFKFCFIIDFLFKPADKFRHIHILIAHAQVFLEKLLVNNRTRDPHGDGAHRQIGFALHQGCRQSGFGKLQQLGLHIGRNLFAAGILNILTVYPESRNSLLRIGRQYRSQIYRTWTLGSIKTPYCMWNSGIHIHGFRTITPARGYSNRHSNIFTCKLLCGSRCFLNSADCRISDNTLYLRTIRIKKLFFQKFGHTLRHAHGLDLQRFADTASSAIDGGPDTNLRIICCHCCSSSN
ncbi:hypothetical protein D3C75_597450 [compost metagenome]